MAFILTNKPREHHLEYTDGVFLAFREFTEDERQRFSHEMAKIRKSKNFGLMLQKLHEQVAQVLLVRWEGIEGEEGKSQDPTDENKAKFFADKEARFYWADHISKYLWGPNKVSPKQDKTDDADEPTEDIEPDFLSSK